MRVSRPAGRGLLRCIITVLLTTLSLGLLASAQSNSGSGGPSTPFLTLTTSTITSTSESRSGNTAVPVTTLIPTTFSITITPSRVSSLSNSLSSSSASQSSASATTSPTPKPVELDTRIDPAFGVLGGVLILTGLPSAFLGHKNRWTSFFLMGFYTLSLACAVLIIQFGVEPGLEQDNHLPSKSLRGMFVLASAVAGIIGGGVSIFFWKGTRYFVGAWGGFAFGLWIECFRNGGLIDPIGFRYIMFIGCAVVGFTLCTIKRIHYYVVIVSTAFVGATSFMLGVDCFTTASLKEFYVWNLGFKALFPKFTSINMRFPVSQAMEIELGLLGAVAIMGIAVQLRVLKLLKRKLEEIAVESRRLNEVEEARAANRFNDMDLERNEWEKDHSGISPHQRKESGLSSLMPLMKDQEAPGTPGTPGTPSTQAMDPSGRMRTISGFSDYMMEGRQSPGAIPALDLGTGLQDDVPENYLADGKTSKLAPTNAAELEELARKEALLSEIQSLRKSIQGLKEDGSASGSRRPSMSSKRTLSNDFNALAAASAIPTHLRAASAGTRSRSQSMNLDALAEPSQPIARPTSTPLAQDWDAYVQDRKLLQPPSGVTPPISPTPRAAVSPAVLDALDARQRREKDITTGRHGASRSTASTAEDIPLAAFLRQHDRKQSSGASKGPVTILPPAKVQASQPLAAPRTRTHEELTARHREKIRELQAPLSEAELQRAQLEKAKERWNRSKEVEREAVTRRQAEKAAAKAKEVHTRASADGRPKLNEHVRTLSADKLATLPGAVGSSRRQSVLKVEDWQTQRLDGDAVQASSSQRPSSRVLQPPANVAFPPGGSSRRMSNMTRDPIN